MQDFSDLNITARSTPKCGDTGGLAVIRALPGKKCLVSQAISNRPI